MLHPRTQRFRATCTLAPHCGHDLKLRVLIVICSIHSHTVPCRLVVVVFWSAFQKRSRDATFHTSISAAAGFLPEVGRASE